MPRPWHPEVLHDQQRLLPDVAKRDFEGRYAAALKLLAHALTADSDDLELLSAKTSTLFHWRRCWEARAVGLRAEALGLKGVEFDLLLGWCCFGAGKLDEAETWTRRAVDAAPGDSRPHYNLAVVLQARNRREEAAASFGRALALGGGDFDTHLGLGTSHLALGHLEAAESQFRRALALDGGRAIAWALLGAAMVRQCRYDEAMELVARSSKIATGDDETFVDFGLHLRDAGRTSEALALYEEHLPLRPNVTAHNDYAYALLAAGRLAEGWNQYEFRCMGVHSLEVRDRFNRPSWAGQDLREKTILLCAEQGFGDVIQFVRYASRVKALGATVLLQVREGLERLACALEGVDRVLDRSELESLSQLDFYIHLPSLPRVFNTTLESVPADIPYLHADAADMARWATRLGAHDKLRVGLSWAGNPKHPNDRFRSIGWGLLEPIRQVAGVRFVSLQKGVAQAAGVLEGVDWLDVGAELEDFADTAAVISQLDLVICVDTAVAHLAGALGKPVWVMLAQPADYRWLEGREDSPWYPTLRLFRQSRRDDWTDVVERVKAALEKRVREGIPPTLLEVTPRAEPVPSALLPWTSPVQLNAGHRPGLSAVAGTRVGILQYLPDEPIVGDAIGWYGEYLQPQLDLLARFVRAGTTMMEVGAGIGAHAVCLGAMLGEAGHMFLYETRPVLQRILRQNLAANEVNNVTVMRRKLGSVGEEEGTAGGVPTTETLDELQLERLDWLKIGASGDAIDVLAGASETLWRLRPLLFLAADDEEALRELVQRTREFGYRCWRMETAQFNRNNFNRRDTDIFGGRTALALLAIPEEIEVDVALDECSEIA